MKRALIVLPLVALLLGALLYAVRRPPAETVREPRPAGAPTAPPAEADAHGHIPAFAPLKPVDPSATGTLVFRVTRGGRPAADAEISVQQQLVENAMKFKTQADGTQRVQRVPVGSYTVNITQEDSLGFSTEVHLEAGQTAVVTAELRQAGRVYGVVTDKAGQPVPDCRVFLLTPQGGPISDSAALSDAQGKYAIRGVASGSYGIRFRHTSYKPKDYPSMTFRNATDEFKVDAVLEVGARITGRVLDEDGAPLEGAELIAGTEAGNGVDASAGLAKSGKDGSFTITGLQDVPANCSAALRGYGKATLRNLPVNASDVVFRLRKSGAVIGRLRIDPIPPQYQVTLTAFDDSLKQLIPVVSNFFPGTLGDGFLLEDVPPGTYWVEAAAEGYEPVERPQVVVDGGKRSPEVIISMRKKK